MFQCKQQHFFSSEIIVPNNSVTRNTTNGIAAYVSHANPILSLSGVWFNFQPEQFLLYESVTFAYCKHLGFRFFNQKLSTSKLSEFILKLVVLNQTMFLKKRLLNEK